MDKQGTHTHTYTHVRILQDIKMLQSNVRNIKLHGTKYKQKATRIERSQCGSNYWRKMYVSFKAPKSTWEPGVCCVSFAFFCL